MKVVAAAALRNLSENNNDNQEFIARAREGSGVKALLAMAKSDSEEAREEAQGALQNLATNNAIDPLVAMGAKPFTKYDSAHLDWGEDTFNRNVPGPDDDPYDPYDDLNPDVRPDTSMDV